MVGVRPNKYFTTTEHSMILSHERMELSASRFDIFKDR